MSGIGLHTFIDESGQRARTKGSSPHFVMSAVVVPARCLTDAGDVLSRLRADLRRGPDHELSWKNIASHSQRLHVVQSLASLSWLAVASVILCKDRFPSAGTTEDAVYLAAFGYLLERLSWLARGSGEVLGYTLSHVVRFRLATLRRYEQRLRKTSARDIVWAALDPRGGALDQPKRLELLQLGDLTASATGAAFNPDAFGNVETRYLAELSPCLYRRRCQVISYGLTIRRGQKRQGPPTHGWRPCSDASTGCAAYAGAGLVGLQTVVHVARNDTGR